MAIKKNLVKLILGFGFVLIIFVIFMLMHNSKLNETAITIDDNIYTVADVNMSLYHLKYNYFGKDSSEISDASLDEKLESVNMTVGEYLKSQAVNDIKIANAIKEISRKNNFSLSDDDLKEIKKEKEKAIKKLGGKSEFKEFLKKNEITETAYDNYQKTNKLYDLIFDKFYASGKSKDLTDTEKVTAKEEYKNTYFKIYQIVFSTVDLETYKSLSDTTINQKRASAETVVDEAKEGTDFQKLINKYSEETDNDVLYFTKDDVLEEIYNEVVKLDENEISGVIETDYAFHIIKRLPLDDEKLDEYYDTKRKDKLNENIEKICEDYKVLYEDAYKTIK